MSLIRARRSPVMRGVAIVLVLVMICVSVVMGAGLWFFSTATHQQVARESFATAADYVAEAACEEGYWLFQQAANDPAFVDASATDFAQLYAMLRQPPQEPVTLKYEPKRLLKHLQEKWFDALAADITPQSVTADLILEFEQPWSGFSPAEYGGTLTFRASVQPNWGGGKTLSRRAEVKRSFNVVLVTPPAPFDRSALTIVNPDYINGESKQSLEQTIFQPTNAGIDAHNKLCQVYRTTVDTAVKVCPAKCASGCGTKTYLNGSPKFLAPRIPESAKIKPDFFFDESVLLGSTDKTEFHKLEDFNYEDILREKWPPLKQIFDGLLTAATANAAVLAMTSAMLAATPGQEMCLAADAFFGLGEALRAVHMALEAVVPIQIMLGQVLLAAMKVVMEGLIVGSLFYAVDQAMQGNFGPALSGAGTFVGDMASAGIFNSSGQTAAGSELQGAQQQTGGLQATDGTIATMGQAQVDKIKDFKMDGQKVKGLADQLTRVYGNSPGTNKVSSLTEMASDSDMSSMTGLIMGFVRSHRLFYTLEFPQASEPYAPIMKMAEGVFDEALWQRKATFRTADPEAALGLFERYRDRGLCGVLFYQGEAPLEVSLSSFKGKFIVYSARAPIVVREMALGDVARDTMTFITPTTIDVQATSVQASLNAVGAKGSHIVFGNSGLTLLGNVLLSQYPVEDQKDRGSNPNALKGELTLNERLDQLGGTADELKGSHLRVLAGPAVLSTEVGWWR